MGVDFTETAMSRTSDNKRKIDQWGYCYCKKCDRIRYSSELEATERGIMCVRCRSYDLEAPDWVICPHHKMSAVNCPRAGKGIVFGRYGAECAFRCSFRA